MDKKFDGELKVMQPESKSDLKARIEALEKEIYKASKPEKKEEIIVSH